MAKSSTKPEKTKKSDERYTKPKLRRRLKKEIEAGGKGGEKGQWSARKAQLLVGAYEKAGGGYVDAEKKPKAKGKGKDERQKSLSQWTKQNWQTSDGKAEARHGDTTERYLPAKAWDELTPAQKRETEEAKREGSRAGKQFVPNSPAAAEAGRSARRRQPVRGYDDMTIPEVMGATDGLSITRLRSVLSYEKAGRNRSTLVGRLERRVKDEES